ncbi:MAG: transglutaminase-like domain-containing protein [Thermoproteota archaeon]
MEYVKASSILIINLIFLVSGMVFKVSETTSWEVYYYELKISFVNRGLNDYGFTLDDKLFLIFSNTSIQKTCILEARPRVKKIHEDIDGNLWAELDFPEKIGPGENFTANIVFMINLTIRSLPHVSTYSSGSIFEIPMELTNYTSSSGVWNYNSTELSYIAELATQIKGNDTNVLRIISKMVGFISERVEYPYGEELRPPQYPNQTLPKSSLRGRGDCDDQSALLIAMLRSVGIPSYLQTGGIISNSYGITGSTWDGHLHIYSRGIGWHGWVEAYVPPWGWLPVDITYGYSSSEPLSAISKSASAREFILQSEKYSNIDYIAKSREVEERIRKSNVYVYVEENVSKTYPSSNSRRLSNYELIRFVILLILLIAIAVLASRFLKKMSLATC